MLCLVIPIAVPLYPSKLDIQNHCDSWVRPLKSGYPDYECVSFVLVACLFVKMLSALHAANMQYCLDLEII